MKQKTINTYIIVYIKNDADIENYTCSAYTKADAYKKILCIC